MNVKSGCNSAGERFEVPWLCNKKWTVFLFFERGNLRRRSRRPCNGRLHLFTIFVYWFGNIERRQNICDVEKNWHLGQMSTWLINNKEPGVRFSSKKRNHPAPTRTDPAPESEHKFEGIWLRIFSNIPAGIESHGIRIQALVVANSPSFLFEPTSVSAAKEDWPNIPINCRSFRDHVTFINIVFH